MIDENYFNVIDSEEKAYFIGFIAADGYISPDFYKLVFCLHYRDIDILNKLCKLTKCMNVVKYRKVFDKRTKKIYQQANLQITSKKFVKSLSKYGLNNNKTKKYIIKNIPKKYIKDCIRGLCDGDGCISHRGVSLISTKENIIFIKKWLSSKNISLANYISPIKKENNVWKAYIYADRIKFLNLIYKNSKISLERKYKTYSNIIKNGKNKNNNGAI